MKDQHRKSWSCLFKSTQANFVPLLVREGMNFWVELPGPSTDADRNTPPRFHQERDGAGLAQIDRRVIGTVQIEESPA
jgi:hypothetical protein